MVPNGTLTSVWGDPRSDGRIHQGEDLAAPRGSPIYAPARLTIYSNTWSTLGGWTISGRDAKGRRWYFGHLNSRSWLATGSTVYKGQVIGYVGSTGNATGPHLHYQVSWPGGTWGNPVDVLRYYPDVP
jgi:murein DD-endopeptidase MepM/ murein hydrolase activator NlpD